MDRYTADDQVPKESMIIFTGSNAKLGERKRRGEGDADQCKKDESCRKKVEINDGDDEMRGKGVKRVG